MLAICGFGLEAELAQLNHLLHASSSLRYSAHGRLDKAIQSMFMIMNYLFFVCFYISEASVQMRSQMNVCVHWLESCK